MKRMKGEISITDRVQAVISVCRLQWPYGWGDKPQCLAGTTELLVLLEKERIDPDAVAVALGTMAEDWDRHESECNPDGAEVARTLAELAKVHDLLGIEMPVKILEAHNVIRTRGMGALEKLCETRRIDPDELTTALQASI